MNLLWEFNEKERKFYDLGWLIGFFEGEGCFSSNNKSETLSFGIAICQKDKEPLLVAQNILKKYEINSSIHEKLEKGEHHTWDLRIRYDSITKFLKLVEQLELYHPKHREVFERFKTKWSNYTNTHKTVGEKYDA